MEEALLKTGTPEDRRGRGGGRFLRTEGDTFLRMEGEGVFISVPSKKLLWQESSIAIKVNDCPRRVKKTLTE